MLNTYSFYLGEHKLTVFCDSTLRLSAEWTFAGVSEDHWRAEVESTDNSFLCPVNILHATWGDRSLIVDTGIGDATSGQKAYETEFSLQSIIDLETALEKAGIEPGLVTDVFLSHADWDHIMGTTKEVAGQRKPFFNTARYMIMHQAWEKPDISITRPTVFRHLSVLEKHGQLKLLHHLEEIIPGITVIPSPGHAPEHAHLRFKSHKEDLFYIGDLFHHPLTITHPDWIPKDNDTQLLLKAREELINEALASEAIIMGAHFPFPGLGKLEQKSGQVYWRPLKREQETSPR